MDGTRLINPKVKFAMQINAYHRAILDTYADGDFAYLANLDAVDKDELVALGDPLLTFMLIELSEEEACENLEQGIDRLDTARNELDVAIAALNSINEEISRRLAAG